MDIALLVFFNKTLANPVLDVLMIGLTTGANFILPGVGIVLLVKKQRRIGGAVLTALIISLVLAVLLQLFAGRPRPETLRFIWPKPGFPSYPSSHAATAFAVATVLALSFRRFRWQISSLVAAILIGFSRLYLGLHYFSDFFGGAVLGAAIGAMCYGLWVEFSTGFRRWRWFLWPQIAIVILLTQMSYLDLPAKGSASRVIVKGLERKSVDIQFEEQQKLGNIAPPEFKFRPVDDIMHFLLFGAVAFWLNIWVNGRNMRLYRLQVPIAIVLPFTFAFIEEGLQFFSPYRTVSIFDLTFDLAGMIFFWWISNLFLIHWGEKSKEKHYEYVSE